MSILEVLNLAKNFYNKGSSQSTIEAFIKQNTDSVSDADILISHMRICYFYKHLPKEILDPEECI